MRNQTILATARRQWLTILTICSCTSAQVIEPAGLTPAVESALAEAGDNRTQLEQVLDHYRTDDDPLKLEAARFLIRNMKGHGYVEHAFFTEDETEVPFDALEYPNYRTATAAMDALEAEHGPIHYGKKAFVPDLESITAEFLINNIDLAFDAWRTMPWARDVSFEIFCEYILPYRGSNEPLNAWRQPCLERLSDLAATLRAEDIDGSGSGAARRLRDAASRWVRFSELYYLHPTDQGFEEMCRSKTGRCEDMTNMMGYAMRAHAAVFASDYTPYWAKRDNNHAWEAVLDAKGKGGGGHAGKAAKIYRKMFSHQPDSLGAIKHDDETVPRWLSRTHYIDVTADYMPVSDVTVTLSNAPPENVRFAYLCVFNGGDWKAIHWGRIDDATATFTNMGRDIAYLPAYYVNESIVPAAPPFILDTEGTVRVLDGVSDATIELTLAVQPAKDSTRATIKLKADKAHELFVWRDGWTSLGSHMVSEHPVTVEGIPAGHLYWLVEEGSRKLERIFTIDDERHHGW